MLTTSETGSFIERKKIALTWHYRRADPEYGAFQARECQKELEVTVAKKYDVEVMTGKANLEVRPKFVNKGEIAKRLVLAYGEKAHERPEFVLCLGDDFTDEGTFLSLFAYFPFPVSGPSFKKGGLCYNRGVNASLCADSFFFLAV